jgi:hypothetical protein
MAALVGPARRSFSCFGVRSRNNQKLGIGDEYLLTGASNGQPVPLTGHFSLSMRMSHNSTNEIGTR